MNKNIELIKKNHKGILFLIFLLGMIGIFLTFLTSFGLGESGYNFLGKTKKITLSPGSPVTQTFVAKESNLHQIRVVLGRSDIKLGEHIEFRLLDEDCQNTLASDIYSHKPPMQGAYTVFSFPAIVESTSKKYCFSATYFSDENRKGEKPYLSATDVPDSVFADRTLIDTSKNKVYPGQTLFLRPAYTSGSLSGDLSRLVDRLSQYKPAFLKSWSIITLFTILIIGSTTLAYYLVFTNKPTENQP